MRGVQLAVARGAVMHEDWLACRLAALRDVEEPPVRSFY